jgi:hypothetical protein
MPGGALTAAIRSAHFGNNCFVVSFDTSVFVSADKGLTWTKSTLPLAESTNKPLTALRGGMSL